MAPSVGPNFSTTGCRDLSPLSSLAYIRNLKILRYFFQYFERQRGSRSEPGIAKSSYSEPIFGIYQKPRRLLPNAVAKHIFVSRIIIVKVFPSAEERVTE